MHKAFARASFGVAVLEIPASGLERRSPRAIEAVFIFGSRVVAGGSGVSLAFGVFLMTDHSTSRDDIIKYTYYCARQ